MKIEFHTADDAGPAFLFAVFRDPKAGGWVPMKGDHVFYGGRQWLVVSRHWVVEEGELAVLRVWLVPS